ncbi:MAG: hypothetical protein LIO67_01840 [Lachnospiraceae bacterium]|nr:hypothetical protein [Lachnospiraceae bacterium]
MLKLCATVKLPFEEADRITDTLHTLGVTNLTRRNIPYEEFLRTSRLNYDCVFPNLWEEEKKVVYLDFSFEDSDEGRRQAYAVEFGLPQIPLNLRYEETA